MNEKIKKISKIILLVVAGLIVLAAAVNFFASQISWNEKGLTSGRGFSVAAKNSSGFGADLMMAAPESAPGMFLGEAALDYDEGDGSAEGQNLIDKKIIKNGALNLYVKNVDDAARQIKVLAKDLDGFIQEYNIYENSQGAKSGNVVIKVPAQSFESAISDIKEIAEETEYENVSTNDATEQYIDLESRIKNSRAEEGQYLEILKKAKTVEETLKVTRSLSNVRQTIEYLEGQLKYLSNQVDMSTIRISLSSDQDIKVLGLRWRPLTVAKKALKNLLLGLTKLVDIIITIILLLPAIILWLAVVIFALVIVWRLVKWLYYKFIAKHKN
ncbi:hypothetical protein COV49_01050 [Candidatus Falkowbacteria bacterium CG11_big_fil_rev_8_21_14_0_20_39_10]|uniref:DUF4349 domain-containing protein n=1 Tax=Candidatus Falkowbacteria bacterium CG11_big_fil_rev_8_21_14_0_20_39_10 TaxID=1974570 RepID=A0A2M6K9Y9_9BACT|nr:MAG: hypothetical protein COV49_01050 [Candidatus Falkowbacteria bacterium CG11_big_fil_rev_8_21_14_0_20_39_10]